MASTGAAIAAPVRACLWLDRMIVYASVMVAGVSIVALFATILAEVIVRYVTHSSLGWSNELPNLLFPWMVMGSIVLAAQFGQHIGVDLLLRLLPRQAARPLLLLIQALAAATFFYLALSGLPIIEITRTETFPLLRLPMHFAYLSVVIGFLLLGVTALTTMLRLCFVSDNPFEVRSQPRWLQ